MSALSRLIRSARGVAIARPSARFAFSARSMSSGTNGAVSVAEPKTKVVLTAGTGRSSVNGIHAAVFGATGFIARYVVEKLAGDGSQVIVPYRCDGMNARHLKVMGDYGQVVPLPCQLSSEDDIRRAVSRSNVVINCVGSQHKTSNYSFHDANVKTAYRIAKIAKEAGVERFIHMSCVGADVNSKSEWISTKAESENVVRAFFPDATILRLCHVYGEEDYFVNRLADFATASPAVPIVNNGINLLQPIYVVDVANAVLNVLAIPESVGQTYHLGGPQVLSEAQMLELVFKEMILPSSRVNVVPAVAKAVGKVMGVLTPRFRVYSEDMFNRQLYDAIVPTAPGTLTMKDLHVPHHDFQPTVAKLLVRSRADRENTNRLNPKPLEMFA